jgi:hypothetical protein
MTIEISEPAKSNSVGLSLVIGLVAISTMLTGCKGSSRSLVEAHGKVLVDGKPAPGALVTLVPKEGNGSRPSGLVKEDGSYEILTYDADTRESSKGAVEGEYGVIVTWVPQPGEGNLETGSGLGDRLKGLYREPAKSNLKVSVKADSPDLGSFELSTSGKR